jgi:two-component sensor histidine kinase
MNMVAPARTAMQRPYRISLIAGPAAAAQARRHICAIIDSWDVPVDSDTAALLTSELVTNAIKHGSLDHDGIQLVVSWAYSQLRVEVHDRSKSGPVLVEAPWDAEAGRGLLLLASLCTSWGWRQTMTGKAVYFMLAPEDGR